MIQVDMFHHLFQEVQVRLKEYLAFEIIDELDNCADGEPCNADVIQKAFILGFEKAREMAALKFEDHEGCDIDLDIRSMGEEKADAT
jgi:hypothetical protein